MPSNDVVLTISAYDRTEKGLNSAVGGLRRLERTARRAGETLKRLGGHGFTMQGLVSKAFQYGALGYGFNRMFVEPAAQFERYQIQLTQLMGSGEKAKKALSWVSDYAQRTPYEVDGLMASFVKLKAFGLDPLDGTLSSIADITAKMGGGQEEMSGIVLALGQAWSKEKLQGEEAMQLMERGIPVWGLLSKATGLSTAQLIKLSSAGKLGRSAIRLLINEMGRSAKGAAESASTTWSGMVGNIMDQWTRFRLMVMDAGLFDFMKGKLDGILAQLSTMAQSGALQRIAEEWSNKMQAGFSGVWRMASQLGPALLKLISISESVAGALGGYDKLVYIWAGAEFVGVLRGLASFAGGLLSIAAAAPAALASLTAITAEAVAMQAALAPIIATMWGIYAVYKATRFILNKTGIQEDSQAVASTPGVQLTGDAQQRLADPNVQKRIAKMKALQSVWTPTVDAVPSNDQMIPWRQVNAPVQAQVGGLVRIQLDGGNARVVGLTKDRESDIDFAVASGKFFYGVAP